MILSYKAYEKVQFYDPAGPSRRNERNRAKIEFLTLARFVLAEEHPSVVDMTDEDLLRFAFHKDRAVRLIAGFLAFVATDPGLSTGGQLEEKIQANTLRRQASCLWFYAVWTLGRDAVNVYISRKTTTNAIVDKSAVQEDLSIIRYEKRYMRVSKINVLFS